MFEVQRNSRRSRVTLIFTEDFKHDRAEVHRDVHDAVKAVKSSDGQFDLLVDMTGVPVIARDRTDSGEELMNWCLANGLRHGAIAVGLLLQEMQLKRLSERSEKFSYFRSVADAESWLNAEMQTS